MRQLAVTPPEERTQLKLEVCYRPPTLLCFQYLRQ